MTLKRREFLERSAVMIAALGTKSAFSLDAVRSAQQNPAIAAVQGQSIPRMLESALSAFGGMKAIVRRGDRAVLLPNPQGTRPGVSTHPELMGELVRQCLAAGASETLVASVHGPGRWYATGIIEAVEKAGGKMHYPQSDRDWVEISLPRARRLKRAGIIRKAVENDVLINVPIVKQHDSTRLTCTMKNLMGFNADNGSFHRSDDYLHQAIADLASYFSPRLCVVDALTILTENGPFGPGRTASPGKILIGTNMVSVDAYCCRFLGLQPDDVGHLRIAAEMGLGDPNVSTLKIVETQV